MTQFADHRARVLHVRPEDCARADEVDQWLGDAGLATELCGDVYSGLALFGQSTPLAAVVLSVDVLDGLEFEFFPLVKRLRPGAELLVYGHSGADAKIEQALAVGATDRATSFSLRNLAARIGASEELSDAHFGSPVGALNSAESVDARDEFDTADYADTTTDNDVDEADHVDDVAANAPIVALFEDRLNDDSAEDSEVAGGAVDPELKDRSRPVQVPWLRAANDVANPGPLRTPPRRTDGHLPPRLHPVPTPRDNDSTPGGSSEGRESLLTPEELAALLGEEFVAFESQKRRPERGQS